MIQVSSCGLDEDDASQDQLPVPSKKNYNYIQINYLILWKSMLIINDSGDWVF